MRMLVILSVGLGSFFSISCGGDDGGSDDAASSGGTGSDGGSSQDFPADTSQAGIEKFLEGETYKSAPWRFDAAPRGTDDVVSPHKRMRVYFNPKAVSSIEAGNGMDSAPHDQGAMVIKELYDDQDRVIGHAVSLKVGKTDSADDWLYYCDGPSADCGSSTTPIYGPGEFECHGCHNGSYFAPLP